MKSSGKIDHLKLRSYNKSQNTIMEPAILKQPDLGVYRGSPAQDDLTDITSKEMSS